MYEYILALVRPLAQYWLNIHISVFTLGAKIVTQSAFDASCLHHIQETHRKQIALVSKRLVCFSLCLCLCR